MRTACYERDRKGLLSARAPSRPQIRSMLGNCRGKHTSELHVCLERGFQTGGNNGKHIALSIK